MTTILLDCDGVLADCATPVHRAAERILRRDIPPPSLWHDFSFEESMGLTPDETALFYRQVLRENSLGWQISAYPGASDFVDDLQAAGFDVCIVTAQWEGLQCWVSARTELASECFPGVDVVFTHAKHRVQGDFLVDDKPTTIAKAGPRGVLFDQPWNRSCELPRRAKTYSEILEMLK